MPHHGKPGSAVAAIAAGGIVAIVGALLTWFEIGGAGADLKGTEISVGLGTLGAGILAVVAGGILWARAPRTGGRGWSITALIVGIVVLIIGAYAAFAPEDALSQFAATDVAEELGVSEAAAEAAIEQAIATGVITVSAGIGAYVVAVGGLIGTLGGVLGIGYARRHAPAPVADQPTAVS